MALLPNDSATTGAVDAATEVVGPRGQKGNSAQAILDVAERVSAELVVAGSQGMDRRMLASIPKTIAHRSGCAVLIVKTD